MILPGLRNIMSRLTGISVIAVLAALTMISCSQGASDAPTGDDLSGKVAFRVVTYKTFGSKYTSRSTWGDVYENNSGIEFETSLIKNQLYVVITDESCTQEYAVTNLVCVNSTENPLTVQYEYEGRIDEESLEDVKKLVNGKLHIIANTGYGAQLSDETSFTLSGQPSASFVAIPMWGVQKQDFSSLAPNSTLNIGDVHLLRAMAKVVIDKSVESDNYINTLKSVTVSTTNSKGYLLPLAWQNIEMTKGLDRNALRVPDQMPTEPKTFVFNNENHVEFYLPEIKNQTGDNELRLTLTFDTEMGEKSGVLYFREYKDGAPTGTFYDVRRNYLYHYIVSMPTDAPEIEIIADLKPYTEIALEPEFGI